MLLDEGITLTLAYRRLFPYHSAKAAIVSLERAQPKLKPTGIHFCGPTRDGSGTCYRAIAAGFSRP
jgi:hypothetical protein